MIITLLILALLVLVLHQMPRIQAQGLITCLLKPPYTSRLKIEFGLNFFPRAVSQTYPKQKGYNDIKPNLFTFAAQHVQERHLTIARQSQLTRIELLMQHVYKKPHVLNVTQNLVENLVFEKLASLKFCDVKNCFSANPKAYNVVAASPRFKLIYSVVKVFAAESSYKLVVPLIADKHAGKISCDSMDMSIV